MRCGGSNIKRGRKREKRMIEGIISLVLIGVGIIGCVLWSANTAIKWQRIATEVFACAGVLALCTTIGCGAMLPERDTAEVAKIEVSEGEQEQRLEITPADTATNITIATESITPEQLIKMFIEKWNGELPDTITVYIPENINYETEKIQ